MCFKTIKTKRKLKEGLHRKKRMICRNRGIVPLEMYHLLRQELIFRKCVLKREDSKRYFVTMDISTSRNYVPVENICIFFSRNCTRSYRTPLCNIVRAFLKFLSDLLVSGNTYTIHTHKEDNLT